MQQAKLEVQQRHSFGKQSSRELRRAGDFPAVLYGRGQDSVSIQLNTRIFKQFLRTHGENVIINMEVPKGNSETVIIKEIQRHPVDKQMLLHVDFIRIALDEPVTSTVPIVLQGTPAGVQNGGILETSLRQLTLRCLPMQMPSEKVVDVSTLEIGDILHVSDLTFDEEITVIDEMQRIVAAVNEPRVQLELTETEEGEEGEEGEVEADEPTEPEVISRRRDDNEEDN